MNKKIFTFLAAVAICGLGALNAQINAGQVHTSPLKQGALYHVGTSTSTYIYPEAGTNKLKLGTVTSANELARGVWCVTAQTPISSTYPEFVFKNKAEGLALGVDLTSYAATGNTRFPAELTYSDVSTWRFSSTFQNGMDAGTNYLMSYLPSIKDSVAVLTVDGSNNVYVEIIKAPSAGVVPAVSTGYSLIQANLYDAAPIVLNAAAFNTLFGSTTSTVAKAFDFIKPTSSQLEASPLKDKFVAADAPVAGYLLLGDAATPTKYLRVDTTVYNVAGNPYLKFAYSKKTEFDALTTSASTLVGQHYFRLVYLPSADSMIINVERVHKPVKGNDVTSANAWSSWTQAISNNSSANIAANHNQTPVTGINDDKTYVVVQNLTNTTYCLTVGETPVQTHIGFGFKGCEVSDNRISREGLYIITNAEGKYLQVPIYTDTTTTQVAKWVTLEKNVDPNQMPSFQWVVEKNRPTDQSVINITNREYADVKITGVQLFSDAVTEIAGANVAANATGFAEVDAKYRKDPYLGYKHVSADIAQVTTYTFNYLHELDATKYLSVKNDQNDSLLHVTDAKDAFELVPYHHDYTANGWNVKPVNYGAQPAAWTKSGYAAQLVRTAYALKIKEGSKIYNTNKVVVVDKEGRYAVTPDNYIPAGDSAVFYLKANNTKDGVNFYALVDTASFSHVVAPTGASDRITVKAGVDDNNMWVKAQNHYEVRTSAFAINENESPLYRRFNREGAVKSESFYSTDKAADVRDTLKFFRVNEPNNFLYEDANSTYSKGLGINFLGQKHKADFDDMARTIQLIVDTAYVARPAVKGAAKDTPKPQYLLWSTLKYVDQETIGEEDPYGCEPNDITEPYWIGRLLINATDSVGLKNVGKNYLWDNKWERLAFVWAVRSAEDADILYIVDPAKFAKISEFKYENLEKSGAVIRKFNLGNNLHKDVVFSFRLYEDEDAIAYADQKQNFFIESETGVSTGVSRIAATNQPNANDANSNGVSIAPMVGGWIKIHNGVPVISRGAFDEKKINDAERFNVVVDNSGETPVANEDITATEVKVVAGNGNVTIFNAAGKTVTISNILGQTVATTTITSDNVTIVAPKGIVVVAIQGEAAVKAIVK